MIIASVVTKMISLTQLLSTCIDANRQGCEIIRNFQRTNNGSMEGNTLKEQGEVKSVVTQADIDAQDKIIGGLRKTWGDGLLIIGEEDEEEDSHPSSSKPLPSNAEILNTNLLTMMIPAKDGNGDDEVPLDELSIFVDPLDGTREFVEGRLQNVACLIGIARNKQALAGVIGLPFPMGSNTEPVIVHYAISNNPASIGSWPVPLQSPPTDTSSSSNKNHKDSTSKNESISNGIRILTGDSTNPVLVNATRCAMELAKDDKDSTNNSLPSHVIIGGTAAKLVDVAMDQNTLAILHFKTELWDTCSPEALISAKGGKITDLFGSPLMHTPDRSCGNVFGVVASSCGDKVSKLHDDLCAAMRADSESVNKIFSKWMGTFTLAEEMDGKNAQAMDVARDLDGFPLDISWIEQQILSSTQGEKNVYLHGYSVPESGSWRGMMSNGGRLLLDWKEMKETDNNDDLSPPSSVFYKRIVMADLAHARSKLASAPHKLVRDVKSYQVETSFLTSRACQEGLIKDTGIRINRVFGKDLRPACSSMGPEEQLQSRFSLLLEDFNAKEGWTHQWLLDEDASRASLKTFATIHAYFWTGSDFWKKEGGELAKELEAAVWPNGGYMQPDLQGYDQLEKVAKGWAKRLPSFEADLKQIEELPRDTDLDGIGPRLEKVARVVGARSHPFYDGEGVSTKFEKYRTIVHGDPKQANIFLRSRHDGQGLEVGLIDFQWCGFGLAATDVAHHICAAVQPACVSYDGKKEEKLLEHYYSCLSEALVKFGVASSEQDVQTRVFPRELLQEQYEVAVLDICRMVFAYAWQRWKAESTPSAASMNRNAYNKSLPSALWLIVRCSVLLSRYEKNLIEK